LEILKQQLKANEQRLRALSHQNILQRGFAIVYREPDQKLIHEARELQSDDRIRIQFSAGSADAKVEKVKKI
jgi:exonuclease VII large subunit